MELTIFPLTTLLLLLSGVTMPRAAAGPLPAIAFVRLWLRLEGEPATGAAAYRVRMPARRDERGSTCAQGSARKLARQHSAGIHRATSAHHQSCLRTHLGAPGVVYRSMAPPAAA